jgi:hypothetical protein
MNHSSLLWTERFLGLGTFSAKPGAFQENRLSHAMYTTQIWLMNLKYSLKRIQSCLLWGVGDDEV